MPSVDLIKAVAVTAELCGRTFSDAAAEVFVADLARYDECQVIAALSRCRREVRGLLTVNDVVTRLDDGRPGVEEAWAAIPRSEWQSVIWTDEMAEAFGIAAPLMDQGEEVAARMAFKEAYTRLVARARDAAVPVRWAPSLGSDKHQRAAALDEATRKGRMSIEHAQKLLPPAAGDLSSVMLALEHSAAKATDPESARAQLRALKRLLTR